MPEIGRWNGRKFTVSSKLIRGFTGLQIKGSSETKEKKNSRQKYVTRENGKPIEVSLTVGLSVFTGCRVRSEAMAFISDARAGKKDYFYIGKKKLVTCKLMLTDATVKEVEISSDGTWVNAEVMLAMKQSNKANGSKRSSGRKKTGSRKTSVRSTPVVSTGGYPAQSSGTATTTTTTTTRRAITSLKVKAGNSEINRIKSQAKVSSNSSSRAAGGGRWMVSK